MVETPIAHSDHEVFQESKEGSTSPRSREVFQHVLNKVMDIQNEDEIQCFTNGCHTEVLKPSLTCV